MKKRKRNSASIVTDDGARKKRRIVASVETQGLVQHPTLRLYYAQVMSLRDYLLLRLPTTSKARRRKISSAEEHCLDRTLVCLTGDSTIRPDSSRAKDFEIHSQQLNTTIGSSLGECSFSQSDLIDYAIWRLFHKIHRHTHRPPHMLCHGFQRVKNPSQPKEDHCAVAGIPGIVSHYPNGNVETMKDAAWARILGLLGKESDSIMLDLVLDHGTYIEVNGGQGNYIQLSGTPLTDLSPLNAMNFSRLKSTTGRVQPKNSTSARNDLGNTTCRSPATIMFVRNRMFHARAALNAKGKPTFGLRHIHVLNRYPDCCNKEHTIHVMKYIFPKHFGLHNVFTSTVDSKQTAHPFKDYTLREQEIAQAGREIVQSRKADTKTINKGGNLVPRRFRSEVFTLTRRLQKLHSQCAYHELLNKYCPPVQEQVDHKFALAPDMSAAGSEQFKTQVPTSRSYLSNLPDDAQLSADSPELSSVSWATPQSCVSAFSRAVVSNLIPNDFWGENTQGQVNKHTVMRKVDQFIRLRRFENMSLHAICQNIKLNAISWLRPKNVGVCSKVAFSDMQKRKEIFLEFLYYVFDSLLIPLIRSNFHVTESNVHQNRLFYFRHDVWRALMEPTMLNFKHSMFEEINTVKARKLLDARTLGFSQIRFLPKGSGFRPITNLRRRVTKLQNGKVVFGRSINSVMAPVFDVLDFHKRSRPTIAGSALFSTGGIYPKLKSFKEGQREHIGGEQKFYFAKVDVRSCFDTIPQRKVVRLMKDVISDDTYRFSRHAEIKISEAHTAKKIGVESSKPARKFMSYAKAVTDFSDFQSLVETDYGSAKKNTLFVDNIVQVSQNRKKMVGLLEDHIERNIIKIGKKFFRQKEGIPQGSVISSLLCNLFYARLEAEYLGFLTDGESLLLRLIDDFLLITTNKDHAKKFLQVMYDGVNEYGVEVNPAKSLANFEVAINGHQVPYLWNGTAFPYCGNSIDINSLEITKDRDRRKGTVLANTLTVEASKIPGKTFYRKALNAFKIQTHQMFLDTNFNSLSTVLSTIYQNFVETAMKYYRYAKCMSQAQKPRLDLLICTIKDLVDLAFVLIKGKHKRQATGFACAVSKCQVQWLAAKAFRSVLGRKQSCYREVIAWLDDAVNDTRPNNGKEASRLNRIARRGDAVFRDYRF